MTWGFTKEMVTYWECMMIIINNYIILNENDRKKKMAIPFRIINIFVFARLLLGIYRFVDHKIN